MHYAMNCFNALCNALCNTLQYAMHYAAVDQERDGITVDQRSSGMRHADQTMRNRMGVTKAKLGTGMMCCHNCPSRGCKDCPMYGVGLNPTYMARVEEQRERKETSGQAQRERDERRHVQRGGLGQRRAQQAREAREPRAGRAVGGAARRAGRAAAGCRRLPLERAATHEAAEAYGAEADHLW